VVTLFGVLVLFSTCFLLHSDFSTALSFEEQNVRLLSKAYETWQVKIFLLPFPLSNLKLISFHAPVGGEVALVLQG